MDAERLERLVASEPSLDCGVEVVFERTEDGQQVRWQDVKDDLTGDQLEALLSAGVVESTDDGFALAAPDAVRIADDEEASDGAQWTRYDKAAAVVAVALFAGYSIPRIRNVVATVGDVVLAPVDHALPFYAVVLLLAVVTGLYSALLQSALVDAERLTEYQDRVQSAREQTQATGERGDDGDALQAEQRDAMGDQGGLLKLQVRPMVWITLLTVPVFLWMRWKIKAGHVALPERHLVLPLVGQRGLREAAIGPFPTWILWYFLCSMSFGQLVRRALNV